MPDADKISFRPLRVDDLPLLHRWLNHGEVLRWYGQRPSTLDEVAAKYTPRIKGESPTRPFIILLDDQPIGYVQVYLVSAYPEHSGHLILAYGEDAAAIDIFIGEDGHRHRGLGPLALRRFLQTVVFATLDVECCVIDPEPDNLTAIRAYEKAGFHYVLTGEIPESGEQAYVMVIRRDEVVESDEEKSR